MRIDSRILRCGLPRDSVLECAMPSGAFDCARSLEKRQGLAQSKTWQTLAKPKNQDRQITITVNNPIIMTDTAHLPSTRRTTQAFAPRAGTGGLLNS